MSKLSVFLCLSLIFLQVNSARVFLMGGAVANNQSQIYVNLANATGRKPSPNKCGDDWKATQCPRIAVVTSAADNQATGNSAFSDDQPDSLSYKSLFSLYGFSPKHISVHIDNYQKTTNIDTAQGKANLQILKSADVVFFNGGDQARHARSWLNNDGTPNNLMTIIQQRALHNQIILSGTSAGSMIMCSPIYGGGITYGHLYFAAQVGLAQKNVSDGGVNGTGLADTRNGTSGLRYSDNGGIMPGFNFTPFLVDTHIDARGRLGRMIPAQVQLRKQFSVGVQQSSAFFYDNGKATVYGRSGALIADISKATRFQKQFFQIQNVLVSYLTSGDSFDFNSKTFTPHSSKKQITQPQYSGYSDSTDIFSSSEIKRLITRLGDQTSSSNIGRSKTPSGYPGSAPTFRVNFVKNSNMKSYWSSTQRKYTDINVTVSILLA